MFLYFDNKGTLKEVIQDSAFRQGNNYSNTLYIYFDNLAMIGGSVKMDVWQYPKIFDISDIETLEIPNDIDIELRYFHKNTPYQFYKYTFSESDLLVSGKRELTVIGFGRDSVRLAGGKIIINIEPSILQETTEITPTEYDYLLSLVVGTKEVCVVNELPPIDQAQENILYLLNKENIVEPYILKNSNYKIVSIIGATDIDIN